jgi:SAM-dependent methyltransferase
MNLDAVWHDLECGRYSEDFVVWQALASRCGGPVLDVGAGTGRVTLELAAQGAEVVALDVDHPLLTALECRAGDLPVATVVADARDFRLDRRFSLIVVPMQTLQLFDGCAGRGAFFRAALAHLIPGGILAAAVADAMDCFDDEHDMPPPPEAREILGTLYTSQLLRVTDDHGRAAIHRRRQVAPPHGQPETVDVVVYLDRVSADDVATEAHQVGFIIEPRLEIPENEEYLGSTVVVLRAP